MRDVLVLYVAGLTLCWGPVTTDAQDLSQLFRKASSSVVVIRATGRDVGASGEVPFNETGSGVLISRDGKVMTAAHVVQSMDEIRVEFVGGEAVAAKVIASEPAADSRIVAARPGPSRGARGDACRLRHRPRRGADHHCRCSVRPELLDERRMDQRPMGSEYRLSP